MKRILTCILSIFFYGAYGQTATPYLEAFASNTTPPTPEAFAFTKYGGIPINESSGLANVNIPIHDFNIGRLKVPVSLSYTSEGVKVDEMNGWAGMSWRLSAGGMVTRTVNDKPDNHYFNSPDRKFYSKAELASFVPPGPAYNNEQLYELSNDWVDTEVDIFNYNFSGYSGSFFLDKDFIPRMINYNTELKIELFDKQNTIFGILITDPSGVKYYFGGNLNSEFTMSRTGTGLFSSPVQTSFYLYKIEDINGDIINLLYTSTNSRKLIGYNQTYEKRWGGDAWGQGGGSVTCDLPYGESSNKFYERLNPLSASEIILDSSGDKALIEINSNRNSDKIIFNNIFRDEVQIKRNIINEISILNGTTTIKKIKFNYLLSSQRYFMNKLEFFGQDMAATDNFYSFEYNDAVGLAPRFSYQQDHMGYYNGKLNQNFIPTLDDAIMNTGFNFADRDADSNYASKGILNKIIYPTKGYTEFEYESGKETWPLENVKVKRSLSVNYNTPGNNGIIKLSHQISTAADQNSFTMPSILNKSKMVNVNIVATVKGPLSNQHKIRFTLDDLNSSSDYTGEINLEFAPGNGVVTTKTFGEYFTFSNINPLGNYVMRLEYINSDPYVAYPIAPNYIIASASISFSNNEPLVKDRLGLRVKKTKDYSADNQLADLKRYYYNKYDNINNVFDSQSINLYPNYISNSIHEYPCGGDPAGAGSCSTYYFKDKVISANAVNSIYAPAGNRYQYVTVSYGGDNFENGGKELSYSVDRDSHVELILDPIGYSNNNFLHLNKYSNTGLNNGTLQEEKYFKLLNSVYTILQKKEYRYKSLPEISGSITNCIVHKLFLRNSCHRILGSNGSGGVAPTGPIDQYTDYMSANGTLAGMLPMNYNIRNYYFGVYYTYYKWYNLDKVTTTDYFASGNIVTSEELFYDSKLAGLPSRKEVSGTNGITSTKYYYPHDLPTEFLMQDLIQANRYEQIRTESFVNNVKTFETKTAYAKDATTGNIARPKFEYAAKFPNSNPNLFTIGQLEKRATYDLYDPKGNILQFTQEGGISTSVIYGYNRMHPLAIIKNATFSEVLSALGTTEASLQTLIVAPSTIRTVLPSSLITTYNYKPLIGVSMITDEKGIKTYYNYDTDGRLKDVRDNQNYILSENDYKIKN